MTFPVQQTVSRFGQVNKSGDDRALFQELFAGEVLTEFHNKNIMMDKHRVRTIKAGKSATFPMVGVADTAKYHTVGSLIQADNFAHSERKVTIDGLLISPTFIANIDEAMIHFDVRSIYTKECGQQLGYQADRNILRMAVKAAGITSEAEAVSAGLVPVAGETFTANVDLAAAGDELLGEKLVDAVYRGIEEAANKNVDLSNAYILFSPAQYYSLLRVTDTTKVAWLNRDVGGSGSVAEGTIPLIGGLKVYMTNNLPKEDEVTGLIGTPEWTGAPEKYRADFSKTVGLIMTPDAVATVKLFDLAVESEYQIERQGTLIVAKYAMGHNVLRPACAIAIRKA